MSAAALREFLDSWSVLAAWMATVAVCLVSLSCGLLAAWQANVLLIRWGVKSGMHDPREMSRDNHAGDG